MRFDFDGNRLTYQGKGACLVHLHSLEGLLAIVDENHQIVIRRESPTSDHGSDYSISSVERQ